MRGETIAYVSTGPEGPRLNLCEGEQLSSIVIPTSSVSSIRRAGTGWLASNNWGAWWVRGNSITPIRQALPPGWQADFGSPYVATAENLVLLARPYAVGQDSKPICQVSAFDLSDDQVRPLGSFMTKAPEIEITGGYSLDDRGRFGRTPSWKMLNPRFDLSGGKATFFEGDDRVLVDFRAQNWSPTRLEAKDAPGESKVKWQSGRLITKDGVREFAILDKTGGPVTGVFDLGGQPYRTKDDLLLPFQPGEDVLRVPLGVETQQPPTDRARAIWEEAQAWFGTPYLWGGTSRSGVDCSGFVMSIYKKAGINLPRTSAEMGESRRGRRVTDELRWGDLLVWKGHVAMYIGDGRTVESRSSSGVGISSIWNRPGFKVIRFLSD